MTAEAPPRPAEVVALNDSAALYVVLAARIQGRAVGWSPSAVRLLEAGIRRRFGAALGPQADEAIARLLALAVGRAAA